MKIPYIFFSLFLFVFFSCLPETEAKEGKHKAQQIETPKEQDSQEEILIHEAEAVETEVVEISDEELYAQIEEEEKQELQKLLQKNNPNIMDYYLALPHSYVFAADCQDPKYMTMEYRKKGIHYQNLKSGYLKHRKYSDNQVVALFKNRIDNKDYIVQLRESQCGDFHCGPDEGFLTLDESGKWINITDQLFGKDLLAQKVWEQKGGRYSLRLPEKGTSIAIIKCDEEDEIARDFGKLVWKQTYFVAELTETGKGFFEL